MLSIQTSHKDTDKQEGGKYSSRLLNARRIKSYSCYDDIYRKDLKLIKAWARAHKRG